jgi:hypothetical protein
MSSEGQTNTSSSDEKNYSRPLQSMAEDNVFLIGYIDIIMTVRLKVRVYLHASLRQAAVRSESYLGTSH